MFSNYALYYINAAAGSWIKEDIPKSLGKNTFNRGLGLVKSVDEITNMMNVFYPKTGSHRWIVWFNHGHYKVINS